MNLFCNCPRTIEVDELDYPFEVMCSYCNVYWIVKNDVVIEQGVKNHERNNPKARIQLGVSDPGRD